MEEKSQSKITLESVISSALQIPGIKVNREAFLREQFKGEPDEVLDRIIREGPVEAECGRICINRLAHKLINQRTIMSSGVSFAAGIPGGIAMAATIPADMIQFYAVALRMAQEIAYLYGEADLWDGDTLSDDRVTNQLILYCGVMLGASGAAQAVRLMSAALAKQILKRLPQQALTKTIWYPVIKSIARWFGVSMTKGLFAKGAAKVVPIIGGVVSGTITFTSMRPMGRRLSDTFDSAHFSYSKADFEADWRDITNLETEEQEAEEINSETSTATEQSSSVLDEIAKAKKMLDDGIISAEEYNEIKSKLLSKL